MKKLLAVGSLAVVLASAGIALFSGCEADNTVWLTIDPEFVDVSQEVNTNRNVNLTFTVDEEDLRSLSLPLAWRVSNTTLGNVGFSSGRSASYVINFTSSGSPMTWPHGVNAIMVEDQYGARGTATVLQ